MDGQYEGHYDGLRNRPSAHTVYTEMDGEPDGENVEELRERLRQMKAIVNDRNCKTNRKTGVDDGFLSVVFGLILCVIAFVVVYAFYALYTAVYRRITGKTDFS